jgi:chromosome segregation protein
VSIELAKAALEGFNITYKSLNEQQQEEIDKRFALEATIATEEAALEQEKVAFIEKEKELQHMQHAFNSLLSAVRDKESEKSLATQRLEYLNERKGNLGDFLQKAEGQLTGIERVFSLHRNK